MADCHPRYEPVEIINNLFLGSKISAHNLPLLIQHQIFVILNCAIEIPNAFQNDDRFEYLTLELDDDPEFDLSPFLSSAMDFLLNNIQQNKRVLVHCQAGISRSVSVILVYLLIESQMTLRDAFLLVKNKRPQAQPNGGFFKYLEKLELELNGKSTFSWKDYLIGVLEDMGIDRPRATSLVDKYGDHRLDILFEMAFSA